MENLLSGHFFYNYFTPNFSHRYFSELLFLVGDGKINKIHQQKLKSGDRLWALEITNWKLRFYGKLFCIRQTFQLSLFCRVSLADLCALLKNTFKKTSEANLGPPQHLTYSFL